MLRDCGSRLDSIKTNLYITLINICMENLRFSGLTDELPVMVHKFTGWLLMGSGELQHVFHGIAEFLYYLSWAHMQESFYVQGQFLPRNAAFRHLLNAENDARIFSQESIDSTCSLSICCLSGIDLSRYKNVGLLPTLNTTNKIALDKVIFTMTSILAFIKGLY